MAKDAKGHGSDARGGSMTPGARVTTTMGVKRTGAVTKPFPVDKATDGTYRTPAMGNVPVKWDDGTQGYEHSKHLTVSDGQAAAALAGGGAKSIPVSVHGGATG
jgi:hypothetical protein